MIAARWERWRTTRAGVFGAMLVIAWASSEFCLPPYVASPDHMCGSGIYVAAHPPSGRGRVGRQALASPPVNSWLASGVSVAPPPPPPPLRGFCLAVEKTATVMGDLAAHFEVVERRRHVTVYRRKPGAINVPMTALGGWQQRPRDFAPLSNQVRPARGRDR